MFCLGLVRLLLDHRHSRWALLRSIFLSKPLAFQYREREGELKDEQLATADIHKDRGGRTKLQHIDSLACEKTLVAVRENNFFGCLLVKLQVALSLRSQPNSCFSIKTLYRAIIVCRARVRVRENS